MSRFLRDNLFEASLGRNDLMMVYATELEYFKGKASNWDVSISTRTFRSEHEILPVLKSSQKYILLQLLLDTGNIASSKRSLLIFVKSF